MKSYIRKRARRSQEGSVAVEAAMCIAFILVPLIFFIFSFGRFFWHYTVVQKAVHDASLYMAKAPMSELRNGAAKTVADFIIAQEISDLDAGTTVTSVTQCGFRSNQNTAFMTTFMACDTSNFTPFGVQAVAGMSIANPLYFGKDEGDPLNFLITSTMRHAGK